MTTSDSIARSNHAQFWPTEDTPYARNATGILACNLAPRLSSVFWGRQGTDFGWVVDERGATPRLMSLVRESASRPIYNTSYSWVSEFAEAAMQRTTEVVSGSSAVLSELLRGIAQCEWLRSSDRLHLELIEHLYVVEDYPALRAYLRGNPNAVRPLIELYSEVYRYFAGSRTVLKLLDGTLFALIETSVSYEDGIAALHALDANWYMSLDFAVICELEIDIRFV